MTGFDDALKLILAHEGGYVNNPRDPGGETQFQEGDIVVICGTPDALAHAEAVLLAG